MEKAKLFTSNRSQAVRLPKAVAYPKNVREVEIVAVGETRILRPAGKRWRDFFDRGTRVSDDFMNERDQSAHQEREDI